MTYMAERGGAMNEWLPWIIAIISGVGAILASLVSLVVGRKQIRPEITDHECRVSGLDVYTYFDEKNELSLPGCPYLSADGARNCAFPADNEKTKKMLEVNEGKCYLAIWSEK